MAWSLSHIPEIELIESLTLTRLAQLKDELIALKELPVRGVYQQRAQRYAFELEQMSVCHRQRKQGRDRRRNHYHNTLQGEALTTALESLKRESQQDSIEHRHLKQKRAQELAPFAESIAQTDQRIQKLKQQYHTLSQQWQMQMQTAYAARQTGSDTTSLPILYQDEVLLVVDKPAGLLSVPGRRYHQQDSVLSRLRCQRPNDAFLQVVHRLDQATSGILVLALCAGAHRTLGQQFSQREVRKTYTAILSRPIAMESGTIDLPLWGNPDERPKQSVNRVYGKSSVTHFQVLQPGKHPRVEFMPHTGRTHQLRVHAAYPQGLNSPILGDSLYGQANQTERLQLHATSLQFMHPVTQKQMHFTSEPQF
ncbi:RluA family pseudouridine synthase [Leptothoe spongobia]|uniref:RNA pseudouridylate synthase n=1 Tax=Leptothoe spongobia TAU-MAC 1115 TaxID=1967444 RepID=A0A947DEI1_9CYAN|nr:RluA family pseudouridine synthase [Leptothoe spongobia]MBT9315425.1 RluA family pseudouridine synthase [Leptothoe spongobia TAU-MAC 1115]